MLNGENNTIFKKREFKKSKIISNNSDSEISDGKNRVNKEIVKNSLKIKTMLDEIEKSNLFSDQKIINSETEFEYNTLKEENDSKVDDKSKYIEKMISLKKKKENEKLKNDNDCFINRNNISDISNNNKEKMIFNTKNYQEYNLKKRNLYKELLYGKESINNLNKPQSDLNLYADEINEKSVDKILLESKDWNLDNTSLNKNISNNDEIDNSNTNHSNKVDLNEIHNERVHLSYNEDTTSKHNINSFDSDKKYNLYKNNESNIVYHSNENIGNNCKLEKIEKSKLLREKYLERKRKYEQDINEYEIVNS